ncbi:MAG: ABC transporter permease [Clostridia bacterium]|nr:ABC transporter permease [Clostridia bacterium]
MSISQSFMLAVKSLSTSKMRAFLTMLGIVIGVAAVIALVSLVNGMSDEMVSSFETIGMKNISVMIIPRGGNRRISTSDMQKLIDDNPDVIESMTPLVNMQATVKRGTENNSTTTVTGVSEAYNEINKKTITDGRFLTYLDVNDRTRNCVIGTYVKKTFFGMESPIGKTIKINGYPFTVVGILEETADGEQGTDDDKIFIPYTTAEKISFTMTNTYTVSALSNDTVDKAKQVIERFLYGELGNEDLYTVISMTEAVDMVSDILGKMEMVLVGIAAISLLVGGIGIMNIMLVSVTERTREIGIRKALGAKPWDILSQFVVEAITTSAIGGIFGIILGILGAYGLGKIVGLNASISLSAIIISVSVSAGIGIAFGYFPARKAAKMNPIEALRHD